METAKCTKCLEKVLVCLRTINKPRKKVVLMVHRETIATIQNIDAHLKFADLDVPQCFRHAQTCSPDR